jgi:guanylate kinase
MADSVAEELTPTTEDVPTSRPKRGRLFVVSGPSGVGKDTVIQKFLPSIDGVEMSVSVTTRAMRPGESDGHPYHFIDTREFYLYAERGDLLEWAEVNGNRYGTPKHMVEQKVAAGLDVILKIDVQGARNVRRMIPDSVLVFIMPPSFDELERRLRARSTETEEQVRTRLLDALNELREIDGYDYAVLNDDADRAADHLRAIFIAERCRVRAGWHGHKAGDSWKLPHA